MKIKLNISMKGYAKGQEITIKDINGVPTDPFWRRRLEDSEIDNCIEIVQTKPLKEKTKPTKGKANDNA